MEAPRKRLTERVKEEHAPRLKSPKFYLWLAAFFAITSVAIYIYEDELLRIGDYSYKMFLFLLVPSIFAALFSLYCYRFPRLGLWLIGHRVEYERDERSVGGLKVEFGFGGGGSDDKIAHSRRKRARAERRAAARATKQATPDQKDDKAQ